METQIQSADEQGTQFGGMFGGNKTFMKRHLERHAGGQQHQNNGNAQ